jgi:hypothetical protein
VRDSRYADQDARQHSREPPRDNADQQAGLERQVRRQKIMNASAHHHAQRKREAGKEYEIDLLRQGAVFAEQHRLETLGPHQRARYRRSDAQLDQQGHEYEPLIHSYLVSRFRAGLSSAGRKFSYPSGSGLTGRRNTARLHHAWKRSRRRP